MSSSQRFALAGIAIVVAVAAFVVLRPDDSENDVSSSRQSSSTSAGGANPRVESIRVQHGKPVGAIKRITVKKGETVRLRVSSADTTSEVHLHGYDVMREMKPGQPASFSVPAKIEGVFEVEIEDTKTQIAKLTVEPS
jgi:FtsP/CotA-like multicopper oxidase with cupredoxin domain